jgi:uncharacterized protein YcbK (DUF882 family)
LGVQSLRPSGWVNRLRSFRKLAAGWVALCVLLIAAGTAAAETRSLKLYYLHTGEKATIAFKKNGQYIPSGLKKINWFLRDWRRNEPTKMDPMLLDLIWEAYRQSGSNDYIHIISGYRSPASNEMLRKRGRGVAKNSQHTLGKAMDFFLPDVKLSRLREIGLKMEVGGVGYYPTSGSPFVHFDTGNVRHWPRMNRQQLAKVFPDGKTMHIPTDGKPLARYNEAVAAYKRREATGKLVPSAGTSLASSGKNFFERLAALAKQDEEEAAEDESANATPAPRAVATTTAPASQTVSEPQFAELRTGVPIPALAPRAGSALALTEKTPTPEDEQQPAEAILTAEGEATSEEDAVALAMLDPAPPVPVERPDFSTVLANAEGQGEQVSPAKPADTSLLALASALEQTGARPTTLDPLTPAEIEDLRRRAIASSKATQLATNLNRPAAPRPTQSLSSDLSHPRSDNTDSGSMMTMASLIPENTATSQADRSLRTSSSLPIMPSMSSTEATTGSPEADMPEKNEAVVIKGSKSERESAKMAATPSPSIVENKKESPVETDNSITATTAAASLKVPPVPTRRPSEGAGHDEGIVMAVLSNTDQISSGKMVPSANATGTLVERPISLDPSSAPEINSNTIGKWAMASDHSIREVADMRAPAYGRNTVRQIEKVILVQGFKRQLFTPSGNAFTGRAVDANRLSVLR